MYAISATFSLMLLTLTAHAATVTTQLTAIKPDMLAETVAYPSNHAVIAQDPLQMYTWSHMTLPQGLVRPGIVMQLWDSSNKVIQEFGTHDLTSTTIDISSVDATLYPSIRIVLFDKNHQFTLGGIYPVYVSYQQAFNTRLVIFVGFFCVFLAALLGAAIRSRLALTRTITRMLHLPEDSTFVHFSIASLFCLSVFAIALGSYTGAAHAIYLIIKLPVLFYGSFCISALSVVLLLAMLGVKQTSAQLLNAFGRALLYMSCLLASFSPLVVFYIFYPFTHDQLLAAIMLLFGIAALGGVIALGKHVHQHTHRRTTTLLVVTVWLLMYGSVLMQLGWMLRPWVGARDPVYNSVPFARPYSGNVFTEITNTLKRLD